MAFPADTPYRYQTSVSGSGRFWRNGTMCFRREEIAVSCIYPAPKSCLSTSAGVSGDFCLTRFDEPVWASRKALHFRGATRVQVLVRDNDVEQALRVLKKRMQREGVFREMRRRRFYEKPSDRITREKAEAVRRARKLARKQAIRDGLIAAPTRKPPPDSKRKPDLRVNIARPNAGRSA